MRSLGLPQLLRYEDRNAMNHSIESRVPFLDHRMVEFLFTLPDEWKLERGVTKSIFRKALQDILPEKIRQRKDKIGFKPDQSMTHAYIRKHLPDLGQNRSEIEKEIFNENAVRQLFDCPNTSDYTFEFMLWRIVNLKLWVRNHWQ